MKKLVAVILFTLLVTGLALAQGTHTGNTAYVPNVDVLGGHNNGGRGCAGCHAPHSGGRGSGGVVAGAAWTTVTGVTTDVNGTWNGVVTGTATPTATAKGTALGDVGLWGTDPGPLQSGMPILYQNTGAWSGYTDISVGAAGNKLGSETFSGIVTCLTCHDGNVSKGAMMSNQSYEQFFNTLPTGNMSGKPLYNTDNTTAGFQAIPTLLGNDGGTMGDYNNDHPIGPMATIAAAGPCGAGMSGGVYTSSKCTGEAFGTGLILTPGDPTVHGSPNYVVTATTNTQYGYFLANYGAPALKNLAQPESGTDASQAWVTCTTCHNQHVMNVYKAGDGTKSYKGALIQNTTSGKYATYFFVNGPYNPGAPFNSTNAPSTMQFCRQCHFSWANESYGLYTVGTAF